MAGIGCCSGAAVVVLSLVQMVERTARATEWRVVVAGVRVGGRGRELLAAGDDRASSGVGMFALFYWIGAAMRCAAVGLG